MIKYRVVEKQIVGDCLTQDDAADILLALRDCNPHKNFDIEEYIWTTSEGKRLGRDPDLH